MTFDERVVNGLRVLEAIVDSGSFVGAGEVLGMSQSGVSRALAKLEARLKIRLFDSTTRKVALTDEGRRFYAQVGPLLAGLEEAVASARPARKNAAPRRSARPCAWCGRTDGSSGAPPAWPARGSRPTATCPAPRRRRQNCRCRRSPPARAGRSLLFRRMSLMPRSHE